MSQQLIDYLQRQISLGRQRLNKYVYDPKGKKYPQRDIHVKVSQYINSFMGSEHHQKRWVLIPGLRGTGKTTVLAQTYYELNEKYSHDINLIYFSLDEVTDTLGGNLIDLLNEYERLLGETYEELQKPTFIMIDEVQSDPKWANVLKSLNERSRKVFLLCSGSSALHLQDNADISGRRAAIEKLYPMNFCEYEIITRGVYPIAGVKKRLKNAMYHSRDAQECLTALNAVKSDVDRYWSKISPADWRTYLGVGSLPFALSEKTPTDVYDAILATIDKVLSRDIPELGKFDQKTVPVIKRLLFILAESDAISNLKLAQVLGVSHVLIAEILEVLVKAELLIKVPPAGSQLAATNKPSKYLFMCPTIRVAFYNIAGSTGASLTRQGRVIEDVLGLHFYREIEHFSRGSIFYDSAEGGADFIVRQNQSQVALEVGRGEKSPKQALSTIHRHKCKYGLTVCDGDLGIDETGLVVKVPISMVALA